MSNLRHPKKWGANGRFFGKPREQDLPLPRGRLPAPVLAMAVFLTRVSTWSIRTIIFLTMLRAGRV